MRKALLFTLALFTLLALTSFASAYGSYGYGGYGYTKSVDYHKTTSVNYDPYGGETRRTTYTRTTSNTPNHGYNSYYPRTQRSYDYYPVGNSYTYPRSYRTSYYSPYRYSSNNYYNPSGYYSWRY